MRPAARGIAPGAEHLFQTLLHRAFRGEPGQGEADGAPDSDVEVERALVQAGLVLS